MEGQGGKRKLSRKAHLRELARKKKQRKSSDTNDPDFEPEPMDEEAASPIEEFGNQAEQLGKAARQMADAQRQRRRYRVQRVRGLDRSATALRAYSLQGLRETVPLSLSQSIDELPSHMRHDENLPACPVLMQRRFARISRQYMTEYRRGADACEAIRAVMECRTKLHARHRDTSDRRSRQVESQVATLAGLS